MDSYLLTSPQGSVYDLGTHLRADPGPDFGNQWYDTKYTENPAADGGAFSYESIGVRMFKFPMFVASSPSGVDYRILQMTQAARPGGAYIDLKPDGVATADMIRFDVLGGRWKPDYNVRHQAIDVRLGSLELDVQPLGYMPTMILLASSASVGGPGTITIPTTSLLGDVPGLAELFFGPTTATSFAPGPYQTDSLLWSLGARPSFQAFWPAASGLAVASGAGQAATLLGDGFAPGSQTIRYLAASNSGGGGGIFFYKQGWERVVHWVIPPVLQPAYRGRFRAFTYGRLGPSQTEPFQLTLDAIGPTMSEITSLASAAPIATLPVAVSSAGGAGGGASPAFYFLSLGEISLPPVASAFAADIQLRLWIKPGTSNPALPATALIDIAGLYLQPLDGGAGVLTRGLLQPTSFLPSPIQGRMILSAADDIAITSATSVVGSIGPISYPLHYKGVLPRIGASTVQLDLNLAAARTNSAIGIDLPSPPLQVRGDLHYSTVSIRYRPRFFFVKSV